MCCLLHHLTISDTMCCLLHHLTISDGAHIELRVLVHDTVV